MKVFEIDNARGAWQLTPGVAQTLSAGVTVTLDTGFSEALIEIDGAATPDQQVSVGGRLLVDVGPWAVGEALTVGAQRFVLLAARQAYVPDALGRASSEDRLAQLGMALPAFSPAPAASPFVQSIKAPTPPKSMQWRRSAIGALAAICVIVAAAAKVTNARDDGSAVAAQPQPSAPAPAAVTPDDVAAPVVVSAPPVLQTTATTAEAPAPSTVRAAKPAPRPVKRPVTPARPALSLTERQQLAAQIDSAALVGGFDPARAREELQKIRPRVAHDSDLRQRLERELGRL